MIWKAYRVVFRLRSPLHVGRGKVGNMQRTRPYVTGRVLWGALTERLTRDGVAGPGPATNSMLYEAMGKAVHGTLAFTYFYPTNDPAGGVDLWPWDYGFRPRFLSTYAGTALVYPQQSADEGSLHEVECIVPHTMDKGEPVYLAGYVLARDDAPDWQSALHRLQVGGERGYGWGRVGLVDKPQPLDEPSLFGWYSAKPNLWPPVLETKEEAPLLAHALASDFDKRHKAVSGMKGTTEPLVGRETHPDGRFGVQVSPARICYAPGGIVSAGTRVQIGPYGIWERTIEIGTDDQKTA